LSIQVEITAGLDPARNAFYEKKEQDHVRDYLNWLSGDAQTRSRNYYNNNKEKGWVKEADCETANWVRVLSIELQGSLNNAVSDSIQHWDTSGQHDYRKFKAGSGR
jgi:hypothetical protein